MYKNQREREHLSLWVAHNSSPFVSVCFCIYSFQKRETHATDLDSFSAVLKRAGVKKAFGLSLHSFPVQRRKCGPAEGRHHRDASEEKDVQSLCDLVTLPQHLFSQCAGENLFSRECVSVSACVCVGGDV